jgi:hypothetical protein
MALTFTQAAPFTGPAYEYLRESDGVPTYSELGPESDPLCRVKLFQPGSRFTYYVCAATEYEGIEGPVLTGYCISPLGPDCDEFGDVGLAEIASLSVRRLPVERDLDFASMRVSEIKAHVECHGTAP